MNRLATPDTTEIITRTRQFVEERMAGQQAGHGLDHALRVFRIASSLQDEVGGSRMVVQLAALLHDVGDAKFNDGVERSAEYAGEFLRELGVAPEIVDRVADIVDNISFRKRVPADKLTLEAKIVQDADRLDALGAIGIVRTIEYGASCGQSFCDADAESPQSPATEDFAGSQTGIGHFHDKLFQIRELLHTAPARRVALKREQFMRDFLAQYFREWAEFG